MGLYVRALIVTLCGVATTALTAIGLVYLELNYDCAIYGFVYGFVLPFGAILSGMVAASGYFLGSRLLNYRPGRAMFVNILGVSAANFFFIYWLKYRLLQVEGEPVRNWFSFAAYLRVALTQTAITVGHMQDHPISLGLWGYLYAAVLILGFALGGYFIFNLTRSAPYCQACSRYMKKQGSQIRYFARFEQMAAGFADFQDAAADGQMAKAVNRHAASGLRQADASTGYALQIKFRDCPRCGQQHIELNGRKRINTSWSNVSNLKYAAYTSDRIMVIETLAGAR